jgi:VanZ family protein
LIDSPGVRASPLARILFALYLLLIAYATLHPLEGWRGHGISPFTYLTAPWPRYVSTFDVAANILGYLPLGVLGVMALYPRLAGWRAFTVVALAATAASVLLEATQTYLPARIASNLDVLANAAGALLGAAIGTQIAPRFLAEGPLKRLRRKVFLPGTAVDLGVALIGLWLFTQLHPTPLLFGNGDLRDLLVPPEGRAHGPEHFAVVEAVTAASNLLALSLLAATLIVPAQPVRTMVLVIVAGALAVKTAAFAILLRAEDVFAWVTPGALEGIAAGLLIAMAAVALAPAARLALAAVLIMSATVLVNFAPPNPYYVASHKLLQRDHFLNFNGLTRLVSAGWPFFALGYLVILASRRPREASAP